jgi:hypothetical protein
MICVERQHGHNRVLALLAMRDFSWELTVHYEVAAEQHLSEKPVQHETTFQAFTNHALPLLQFSWARYQSGTDSLVCGLCGSVHG